jgi:hypothetical protein
MQGPMGWMLSAIPSVPAVTREPASLICWTLVAAVSTIGYAVGWKVACCGGYGEDAAAMLLRKLRWIGTLVDVYVLYTVM